MKRRSAIEPEKLPLDDEPAIPKGHDVRSLGAGDSSDTGSDLMGSDLARGDTSDRQGTGERATWDADDDVVTGGDIAPDRIVGAQEAGLGGGLDQAEEAILGITDEEIRRLADGDDDEFG